MDIFLSHVPYVGGSQCWSQDGNCVTVVMVGQYLEEKMPSYFHFESETAVSPSLVSLMINAASQFLLTQRNERLSLS